MFCIPAIFIFEVFWIGEPEAPSLGKTRRENFFSVQYVAFCSHTNSMMRNKKEKDHYSEIVALSG